METAAQHQINYADPHGQEGLKRGGDGPVTLFCPQQSGHSSLFNRCKEGLETWRLCRSKYRMAAVVAGSGSSQVTQQGSLPGWQAPLLHHDELV